MGSLFYSKPPLGSPSEGNPLTGTCIFFAKPENLKCPPGFTHFPTIPAPTGFSSALRAPESWKSGKPSTAYDPPQRGIRLNPYAKIAVAVRFHPVTAAPILWPWQMSQGFRVTGICLSCLLAKSRLIAAPIRKAKRIPASPSGFPTDGETP